MDLMAIRRGLMSIGGQSMVGEFSKYEKKSLTFTNAEDSTDWNKGAVVPCSFEPKVILFYGGDSSRNGTIQYGIFYIDVSAAGSNAVGIGLVRYKNTSGTNTNGTFTRRTTSVAGGFTVDNNVFYAARVTSGSYWQPSDTYTFEIYG